MKKVKIGDLVNHITVPEFGIGIVLEVLDAGIARKNTSALVLWSNVNKASYHTEFTLLHI